MATTTSANVMTSGNLDTFVYRTAIKNYQENLYFKDLAMKQTLPQGSTTFQFMTIDSLAGTVAALTEGTTPSESSFRMTAITVTATGYGALVILSDKLLRESPINCIEASSVELGFDLARKIDKVIQDELDSGTNVIYSTVEDASAGRTNVDDGDIITANLVAEAVSRLRTNAAPTFEGGYYVAVMHPHVYHDLMTQSGTGTFIDVNKYATPEKIFKGEVGAIYGVRVVVSPNVQFYANASDGTGGAGNFDVYPTYVIGRDCFAFLEAGGLETILQPLGSGGTSDGLAQRASVGAKAYVGVKILKNAGLYRIESASSLGANSS